MSNYEIESHELLHLENKRKSKANSFYVLKFTEQHKINLLNKKINITKKANSIDLNNEDKKMLQEHNENIKQSLEKYILDKEFDVKNNIEKIMFNDLFNNNKINFGISSSVNTLEIQKNDKYDCTFLVKRMILIFTKPRICEVSVILQLSSLGTEGTEQISPIVQMVEENESGNNSDNDTTLNMSDLSESINLEVDNKLTCNEEEPKLNKNKNNKNTKNKNNKNNKNNKKSVITVDTFEAEGVEEPKVIKKRGRPKQT
jgi:hypothetical protein